MVKAKEGWHRNDARAGPKGLGRRDRPLHFAATREQDVGQRGGFLDQDISTLQYPGAAFVRWAIIQHRHRLATQCQEGRTIHALHRGGKSPGGFLRVGGTNDIEIRNHPQAGNSFHRLMGWAVLADADGVVRVEINDRQLRERGKAHRRTRVIGENEERRARGPEDPIIGDAIVDGRHAVLTNAVAEVAAGAVGAVKILVGRDIVQRRAVEVGAAGNQQRQFGGDGLEDIVARRARGEFGIGREERDLAQQMRGTRRLAGAIEQRGFVGMGRPPGGK